MQHSNATTNYGLPQWEEADKPVREDFNEAFEMIDEKTVSVLGDQIITGNKVFEGGFDANGDCNFNSGTVEFNHSNVIGLRVSDTAGSDAMVRNISYGTEESPSHLAEGEIYLCFEGV